jgi:hypothetical protein
MKRQIVVGAAAVAAAAGSATLVAQAATGSHGSRNGHHGARAFAGYWMGIDPLDGGDSRRGITRNGDGTFAMIGRDTVFTLCDGTDRAIVTGGRLALSGRALASDDFLIKCTNTSSEVHLKVRYEVVARNVVLETLTSQSGDPVDKILFHRVSDR